MTHAIRPTTPDDLPDLGRFLAAGFAAPAGAAFADPAVLRWKYFDPRGPEAGDAPRSLLARDEATGAVVGHVGVCPGRWHGGGLPAGGVSTLHMIDWLGSEAAPGVGAQLMRRAHRPADTQYGFGGSDAGRGVIGRGGYERLRGVPVFQRVLRLDYRLRAPGPGTVGRWLRVVKDAAGLVTRPARRPGASVTLRPVGRFGDEVRPWLEAYGGRAVFTTRGPEFLNHVLAYPRGGVTGWHLLLDGEPAGLAVLALLPQPGGVTLGRVAECLLARGGDDAWHAAAFALASELRRRGADLAQAVGSTDWSAAAWRACGFAPVHELDFRLRDRDNLLPRDRPWHLTMLEADYAYT